MTMIDIDPRFGMSDRDVRIAMKAATVAMNNRWRPVAAAGENTPLRDSERKQADEAERMETREMLERLIIKEREEAREEARLRQTGREDSERRRKALLMRMDSYEISFNVAFSEELCALENTPRKLLMKYHPDKVEKMADPELLAKFPERMKKLFDEASKQLTSKLERR